MGRSRKQNTEKEDLDSANSIKEFFKQWPGFYYFIFDYFSPVYFGGVSPKKFLRKYHTAGACYNLGSGARRINAWVKNIDAMPYSEVDIVADITNLPIENDTATTVICDQVLEHVQNPGKAVDEIKRILKPNGYAYVSVPLLYPFHASPSDYQRWTHKGYENLFSDFEIIEVGVRSGPFSTLTVYLAYLLATMFSFGSERLYWFLVLLFGVILFPIKLLDVIGNRLPNAIHMSAIVYCIVKKKNDERK